jgi:hypothetical protein
MVMVLLSASGIGLDWIAHVEHQRSLWVLDNLVRLAFVLMLAVIVTVQVFRRGNVTHHRVQGAICVYLLAGLAWAYSFDLLFVLDHSAFRVAEVYDAESARRGMLRYFSFATLTTIFAHSSDTRLSDRNPQTRGGVFETFRRLRL